MPLPTPENHATQKTVADLNAARDAALADLRSVFRSDAGKRVLEQLRQRAGHGKPSFLPSPGGGPIDPYAAAFRDGRKSLVDELIADLASPEDEAAKKPKGKR